MSPEALQAGALGVLAVVLVGVGRFLRLIVLEAREHRHQLTRLTVLVSRALAVNLEDVDAVVGPPPSSDGGGTMGKNILRAGLLLALAVVGLAAFPGCVRLSDGTLSVSTPPSSARVTEVEDALLEEQRARQEEDAAIRKAYADAVAEHRQAVEDALAALRADTGAEAVAIRGALAQTAADLRAGLDPTQRLADLRVEALDRAAKLAAAAETNARADSAAAFKQAADALTQLKADHKQQRVELEGRIDAARSAEVPWVEILAASTGVGAVGAGTVGLYGSRKRRRERAGPAPSPGGAGPPGPA